MERAHLLHGAWWGRQADMCLERAHLLYGAGRANAHQHRQQLGVGANGHPLPKARRPLQRLVGGPLRIEVQALNGEVEDLSKACSITLGAQPHGCQADPSCIQLREDGGQLLRKFPGGQVWASEVQALVVPPD